MELGNVQSASPERAASVPHDKFCNCSGNESECQPLSATDPICIHCECPFIERIRADEREKAAQRVLALYGYDSDPGEDDYDNWKHSAHLAAAAALGGEQA